MSARKLALKVLSRCRRDGGYSNLTLDSALKNSELSDADKALATQLVFGVITRKITLDHYISKLSSIGGSKIEPDVRDVLRMGLYQLIYLDRIPAHAAVNESVTLVPSRARGFVNAVLRNWQRKGKDIALPDDPIEKMSVLRSYPVELCEKLVAEYGYSDADACLESMNETPPLTVRVNTIKTSRDDLLRVFLENGIDAEAGIVSPYAIRVKGTPITRLLGFDEGVFFAQDEASQICVAALGVKPGDTVIDVCSAPGGKSFGAAMMMENTGKIHSFDLHDSKISLIRSGAENLGINIIEARAADARDFVGALSESADAVLCDVPCSGYGVMAKKPEIRFKSLSDAARLPEIQYAILENASKYVKKGGTLVYSTCTILPEENGKNVERFISEHKNFIPEGFTFGGRVFDAQTTLLPHKDGTDGFFVAKFTKKL